MFDKIKKFLTKFFAFILLSILLASFAIWGVGDIFKNLRSDVAAKIGKESISKDEFKFAVESQMHELQRQWGGKIPPEMLKMLGVEKNVLIMLAQRKMLEMEAERLGIRIGDNQIASIIRNQRAFFDDKGKFNKTAFDSLLRKMGYNEASYYKEIRNNIALGLLENAIASNPVTISSEVEKLQSYEAEKRVVKFLVIPPDYIKEIADPEKSEISSYYESEKQNFSAPEYRSLSYIILEAKDVEPNISVSDEKLKEEYEVRIDEFRSPENRVIERIVLDDRTRISEIEKVLKGGDDFYKVAKEKAQKDKDDLLIGELEKDSAAKIFSDEIAEKIFALKEGEISPVLEKDKYAYIFRITRIIPASQKSFESVRENLKKDLIAEQSLATLSSLAEKIQDEIAGGAKLEDISTKLNLRLNKINEIDLSGKTKNGEVVNKLPDYGDFLKTAFSLDNSTVSQIVSSEDGMSYFVVRVDEIMPQRERALEEVQSEVTKSWKELKARQKLRVLADDTAKNIITSNGTLEKAAEKLKLKVAISESFYRDSDIAEKIPPALIQQAFTLEPDQYTNSYLRQDGAYVIAELKEIIPAAKDDSMKSIDVVKGRLEKDLKNELMQQYLNYLYKKYDVKLNYNQKQ